MQGGWHPIGLSSWFVQFAVRVGLSAGAEPATFTITDRAERFVQPVGCIEPAEGEWRVTVSWAKDVPCKPASKHERHAIVLLEDAQCASGKLCRMPRPGETFRATMIIDAKDVDDDYQAQAIVNVLRHEPPYVFLSIETEQGEVAARGVIRVKLYKKLDDRVDPESWRTEP